MTHLIGMITQLVSMIATYVTVFLIVSFDSLIFGLPVMWVYNNVFATKFAIPEFTYFEMVLAIFLFKIIAVLWKSVHMDAPETQHMIHENNRQENNEKENG
jgi:hypothetical protein